MVMARAEAQRIDVKRAVQAAMDYVRNLYAAAGEKISNLGLEEVVLDKDVWRVTVGFSRPWDYPKATTTSYDRLASDLFQQQEPSPDRDYKVVKVDPWTGESIGMEMREE
jgi:hypothetical protein